MRDILKEFKFSIIFLVIVLVGFISFMVVKDNLFTDIPKCVEDYCKEKYRKNFTWIEYVEEKSSLYSRVSVVKDEDGVVFEVIRSYTDSDTIEYSDNYMGIKSLPYIKEILNENIENSARYTIVVEDCIFNISENYSIDDKTVIALNIQDKDLWSKEEVEEFCKSLPFRVNVVQVCGSKKQHFATTEDFSIIYR